MTSNILYYLISKSIATWHNFYNKLCIANLIKTSKHIGDNVTILPGFQIGHQENLEIESNVSIGKNSFINAHGGVYIGAGCVIGPNLTIFSVNHIVDTTDGLPFCNDLIFKPVRINENCWIGANVFIVPGVEIGEGSVVAGGAVVTHNFPPCSVIAGNPAKLIKSLDQSKYQIRKNKGSYCDWILNS